MKTLANVYFRFTCFFQLMVLGNLPVRSILNLSCACRELRSLSNDSTLWQHLVFRDFGKPQLENCLALSYLLGKIFVLGQLFCYSQNL